MAWCRPVAICICFLAATESSWAAATKRVNGRWSPRRPKVIASFTATSSSSLRCRQERTNSAGPKLTGGTPKTPPGEQTHLTVASGNNSAYRYIYNLYTGDLCLERRQEIET